MGLHQAWAVTASFDPDKMADMSDFDPGKPINPTGDTIKVAVVASFSGPAAIVGQIYFISAQWAAHDINKRGGILVDGNRKICDLFEGASPSFTNLAQRT
jgi:branched-chain amino acid transport system substrate-binding protein